MTVRSLMAAGLCAIVCIGAFAAGDSANAAFRHHKRSPICRPFLAGPICPPFRSSICLPGCPIGYCAWSACRPWFPPR